MLNIDSQIAAIYSQYWDQIEQRGKLGQKFLLVEGDDDRIAIEGLLSQQSTSWSKKVVVAAAFGRGKVLAQLKRHPDWFGLVDRDTWNESEVVANKALYPNLEVTDGWCLENHFCHADVLESTLKLQSGQLAHLSSRLADWVSYGAIRLTMKHCRDEFWASLIPESYGRPDKLATEPHDRSSIQTKLMKLGYDQSYSKRALDSVLGSIEGRQRELLALPIGKQILLGIHGKEFFQLEVAPTLSRLLRQQPEDRWRAMIANSFQRYWPAYLLTLANRLL